MVDFIQAILTRRLKESELGTFLGELEHTDRKKSLETIRAFFHQVASLLEVSHQLLDNLLMLVLGVTTQLLGAERGTLFLIDQETGELFSRVAQGDEVREIRIPLNTGIAGAIATQGKPVIIGNAYADPRFNSEIDKLTGFRTRDILGAPIRVSPQHETIGVLELLNKKDGTFNADDLTLLEMVTSQAAIALRNARDLECNQQARENEVRLQEVTTAISSELKLKPLLEKIMQAVNLILNADRATLFLHDEKTNELWSQVALGLQDQEIRFPAHLGIAGRVFTSGETINIPEAYADPRFNKEIDRKTGYVTRNILCMPVINKTGKAIGVTQVLNKKSGVFTRLDEKKLRTFSAQAAIAIENAKLFDEVLNMKNYSESILESLSNGVISVNAIRRIEKCNAVALKTFGVTPEQIIGKFADIYFTGDNHWIVDSLRRVIATQEPDNFIDSEIVNALGKHISMNMAIAPLHDAQGKPMGGLLVFEDLTTEKRMKSTLARYMTKEVADQLLTTDDAMLGGKMQELTVLFSDIRHFTTISEKLGPQATVSLLNEYFSSMVDIVFHHGGILDKFIGDALLAVFGAPFASGEDPDRAVTTAIEMIKALKDFNRGRAAKGLEVVEIGVGINTDHVLVGNIGSLKRMDYTVIGDGVNLASRLESANKFFGTNILVSEGTMKQLKYRHLHREVDLLRVKGKLQPSTIFEILDHHDRTTFPHLDETIGWYQTGLMEYRKQNWAEAEKKFQQALALHPGDRLSQVYLERCHHFAKAPPPPDWDGVWVMESKS